jgi:type IV pilus assembly protein PilC
MDYLCRVGTPGGEVVEETFSAVDEAALRADLEQKGYYLFSIRRGLAAGRVSLGLGQARIPGQLLLVFGQELAALLKAGLPLLQSLDVMLERQRNPIFRRSLSTIREKVKAGVALSEAFRAEGRLYPPIFAASLVAGERSGSLETVLRRFVQYVRLNQSLKKKAIAASVYPLMLVIMMIVLVAIMLVQVIPQFEGFYEGLNVDLPLPTRVLMTVGSGIRGQLPWIVLFVIAVAIVVGSWLRREGSGVIVDRWLLRIPHVGQLMRMYATSQLARSLATLLSGGLPLLNALEVASQSIGNRAMAAAVAASTPQIREGRSLTTALESTGMLENLTLEMVKVGEHTGALADMLLAVADFYDEEMDTRLATLLALVEPVMLVLMAIIVAGMLLAFYLPLFQAISAVQVAR